MNWRKHLQVVVAITTEDRLWTFVSEQAQELAKISGDENMNNESKKQAVTNAYESIREAFKQLGVIR